MTATSLPRTSTGTTIVAMETTPRTALALIDAAAALIHERGFTTFTYTGSEFGAGDPVVPEHENGVGLYEAIDLCSGHWSRYDEGARAAFWDALGAVATAAGVTSWVDLVAWEDEQRPSQDQVLEVLSRAREALDG